MPQIVLASGSPRRRELLERIGVTDFIVRVPDVEESVPEGLTPEKTVACISREKAEAAARLCGPEDIIITADTMVFLEHRRLGKPHSEAEALEMLTALQGRRHTVCTGVTVRQGDRSFTESETTDVYFRPASQGELLVERLDGDFFNVMGLPVLRLSRMLQRFGVCLLPPPADRA